MSSNSENHNTSTTAPMNMGDVTNESQRSSSQTVELSGSAALSASGKNSPVLTTESIASSILTTAPTNPSAAPTNQETAILSDATVIRSRTEQQEQVNSNASNFNSSSMELSNANVTIIQDSLFNAKDPSCLQIGDYQILESIGGGGMGRIFRAWDTHLDREVALKILAPNQQSEEFRERFVIEAKASAKLHHDNIVSVYSFGQSDGLTYLVMEYIPGSNIRDLVTKKGPLSIEDTLTYAIQLASALEHINANGIVHRDIKPSNVLITNDGVVKVIDLGLAKNIIEPSNDLTQTGVTLGTFDYISPEQARDPRNVDIRSDIYSLGCSLFFMLTGQPPYPKGTGLQKLLRHQGDAAPNVQDFRSDVPDRFADIITRCMAKNPDLRYQTPQDLSKALYVAAEGQGMRPSGYSMSKWYMPSISRLRVWKDRLAWTVPIVFLIIAILVLDNVWKPNQRQSEFLPEKPGLKRSVLSVNSDNGFMSDNMVPGPKVKPFNFNIHPKAYPQSPSAVSMDNKHSKTSDNQKEPVPAAENNLPSEVEPVIPPPMVEELLKDVDPALNSETPQTELQDAFLSDVSNPSPDNAPQENSTQRKKVHSVTLEND